MKKLAGLLAVMLVSAVAQTAHAGDLGKDQKWKIKHKDRPGPIDVKPVPEPNILLLLGVSFVGMGILRRHKV